MKRNKADKEPERSIFVKLLGDYPSIRILNHFLIFREFDYSLTEVAESSGVAWSTLNLLWPKLEENKIVIFTRNVGKAKMFKLNTDNSLVQNLIKFGDAIVWDYTNKEILKKGEEIKEEKQVLVGV